MRERERLRRAIKLPTYTLLAGKAGQLLLLLQATLKQLRRWWWHQHHWIWLVVVSSWSCTCPPSTWWCRSRRTTGRCSQSPLRASLRLELHVRHEHHHNLDDFYILFHANFQNGKNFPLKTKPKKLNKKLRFCHRVRAGAPHTSSTPSKLQTEKAGYWFFALVFPEKTGLSLTPKNP